MSVDAKLYSWLRMFFCYIQPLVQTILKDLTKWDKQETSYRSNMPYKKLLIQPTKNLNCLISISVLVPDFSWAQELTAYRTTTSWWQSSSVSESSPSSTLSHTSSHPSSRSQTLQPRHLPTPLPLPTAQHQQLLVAFRKCLTWPTRSSAQSSPLARSSRRSKKKLWRHIRNTFSHSSNMTYYN